MTESLGTLEVPPSPEPAAPGAATPSGSGPHHRGARVAAALVLLALALGVLAGMVALTAPSTTVVGEVGAFGGSGRGCYPTVSYEVGGETYRFTADRDARWCALDREGPAVVYHDPDFPAEGRLDRYGDRPWLLVRIAIVLLVAAVFAATWGRRGDVRRPWGSPESTTSRGGSWGRVPRVVAWSLVAGWVVTAVGVCVLGERSADFGSLQSAVERGEVDVVQEAGGLDPGYAGRSVVELRWRHHGVRHVAEVEQLRGSDRRLRRLGNDTTAMQGVTGRIQGDLTTYFTALDPDVRVEPTYRTSSGMRYEALGWRVTGWLLWPILALLVMTLRLLAVSPEPWRATRWGWLWPILVLPVIAPLAFLLLGGPTGAARAPDPRVRRFGGGWSLVLMFIVSGLINRS